MISDDGSEPMQCETKGVCVLLTIGIYIND